MTRCPRRQAIIHRRKAMKEVIANCTHPSPVVCLLPCGARRTSTLGGWPVPVPSLPSSLESSATAIGISLYDIFSHRVSAVCLLLLSVTRAQHGSHHRHCRASRGGPVLDAGITVNRAVDNPYPLGPSFQKQGLGACTLLSSRSYA